MIVAETGQAVLTPMIGARAGLIVAEILPGVPVRAVVLANGAPLAFAEVGSPLPPWHSLLQRFIQPLRLGRLDRLGSRSLSHDLLPTGPSVLVCRVEHDLIVLPELCDEPAGLPVINCSRGVSQDLIDRALAVDRREHPFLRRIDRQREVRIRMGPID